MKIIKTALYLKKADTNTHPPVSDSIPSMWGNKRKNKKRKKIYQKGTDASPLDMNDMENI